MADLPLSGKRMLLTGGRRFGACICSAEHSAGLVFSTLGFTAVSQPLGGPCSTNTCAHSYMARMKFRRLTLQDPKSLAQLPDAQSCDRPPDNSTKQKVYVNKGMSGGVERAVSSYTTNYRHLRKTILAGF